jgi:putative addiction module CopG family antidote
MEIKLTPDLLKFVEDKVKAGQFGSASDVIVGALDLLRQQEALTEQDLAELREEVKIGLDQLDAGHGGEWDVEATKSRLRARVEQAKRAS